MKIIMLGAPGPEKEHRQNRLLQNTDSSYFHRRYFPCKHQEWYRVGKKAKTYMDQGALVPDELPVTWLWIESSRMTAKTDLYLDGFPEQFHRQRHLMKL